VGPHGRPSSPGKRLSGSTSPLKERCAASEKPNAYKGREERTATATRREVAAASVGNVTLYGKRRGRWTTDDHPGRNAWKKRVNGFYKERVDHP